MGRSIVIGAGAAAAAAALGFAVAVSAQTPPPNEAAGLPYCSAKVKDRCIQKSDIRREKAAAKAG